MKFGAHPIVSISIERCLIEIMKDRSLRKLDWVLELDSADKYNEFDNQEYDKSLIIKHLYPMKKSFNTY